MQREGERYFNQHRGGYCVDRRNSPRKSLVKHVCLAHLTFHVPVLVYYYIIDIKNARRLRNVKAKEHMYPGSEKQFFISKTTISRGG